MSRQAWHRCLYTVPGGIGGDQCRRFRGHEVSSEIHAQWHFPDCGSAVTSDGKWITDARWMTMFAQVEAAEGFKI